jgi:hypothetical protein
MASYGFPRLDHRIVPLALREIWPAEEHTAGELSRKITRAARKLQRMRNASAMLYDDPRFGHLIREMDLNVTNLREAADILVARKTDPVNPQLLIRLLIELHRTVRAPARMSLEAELFSLTDGLGSERDRRIIMSYLGWDGKPPRTLEEVGQKHKMTRERVRQICERVNTQWSSKPFLPVLDRVLRITFAAAPTLAEEIENQLFQRRLTESKFPVESVRAAAHVFGREIRFRVEELHGHRFVVRSDNADLLTQIDHAARAAVSHWGVTTVDDVAAATNADPALARKVLVALPGFRWLDESSGWFWIANMPRNALLTQIRKILSASPTIDVSELRTGVGRHHRRKGFAPPRRVLLELCRQLPWCRVADDKVTAAELLNPNELLSDSEQRIFIVLKEHGPVMQTSKFEELCVNAGVNHHTFSIYLSYSPIITRYAPGVYGLRGVDMPVGLVESLIPKRSARSKLLIDYGWVKDRHIQVVYKISSGTLSNGIVSIPSALKNFLQGRFVLKTADNSNVGALVIRDNSAWGLGPFFTRRGGEVGDYLSIVFDLSKQEAVARIGDASLIDELGDSATPFAQSH